jgi:hypothetical protein
LYYWTKHHGFWGVLGIRGIIFFRHLMRYTFAALSGLARPQGSVQNEVRKQVSAACLWELLSGSAPNRA